MFLLDVDNSHTEVSLLRCSASEGCSYWSIYRTDHLTFRPLQGLGSVSKHGSGFTASSLNFCPWTYQHPFRDRFFTSFSSWPGFLGLGIVTGKAVQRMSRRSKDISTRQRRLQKRTCGRPGHDKPSRRRYKWTVAS